MKALLLAFFAFSPLAMAGVPEGFVTSIRELDFKGVSPTTFQADVSKTDFAIESAGSGWAKFFGGIEVLSPRKVHYRLAGLFSGEEGDFPAHIERFADGSINLIVIPAQAFRFWNKPDRIYDTLTCLADGHGGLECHQVSYIRAGTFEF